MKEFLIKARRAIRYLFYKNVSIQDQLNVSKVLDDSELELLFWKLSKADRHHSVEVMNRAMKKTSNFRCHFFDHLSYFFFLQGHLPDNKF